MILTAVVRLPRRHDLDGRLFLHQLEAAAAAALRRPRPVRAALVHAALAGLDREPGDLRHPVADLQPGHRLPARRAPRPEDPLRGHLPHHLPLSLRALLHRHRPRLAVDPEPRLRRPARRARPRLGELHLRPALQRRHRHLRHPDRRPLAGHRAHHVPDARRPARHRRGHLEGGARRRHPDVEDLPLRRHPDDAAGLHHHARHHHHRHRQALRPRRRADRRRPGHRLGGAGEIRLRVHVPGAEPRPGLRRLDDDAAHRRDHPHPLGLPRIRRQAAVSNPDALAGAVVADTVIETRDRAEPRGARPRRDALARATSSSTAR